MIDQKISLKNMMRCLSGDDSDSETIVTDDRRLSETHIHGIMQKRTLLKSD